MLCHNNNHDQQNEHKSNSSKWIYVLTGLCVSIVIILLVFVFKVAIGKILIYAVILACPLMHLFMMKRMHNTSGSNDNRPIGQSKDLSDLEKVEKDKKI